MFLLKLRCQKPILHVLEHTLKLLATSITYVETFGHLCMLIFNLFTNVKSDVFAKFPTFIYIFFGSFCLFYTLFLTLLFIWKNILTIFVNKNNLHWCNSCLPDVFFRLFPHFIYALLRIILTIRARKYTNKGYLSSFLSFRYITLV